MLFSTIDQKGYMHKIWRGIGGNSQFVSRVFFLYACFSCSLFIFFCMRYLKVVPIYWFGICLFLIDFVFVFFMQIEIVYNYGREDNDWNLIFSCILTMNKGLQSNCSVFTNWYRLSPSMLMMLKNLMSSEPDGTWILLFLRFCHWYLLVSLNFFT